MQFTGRSMGFDFMIDGIEATTNVDIPGILAMVAWWPI